MRMSQGTYERATVLRRRFQEAFKEVVRRPSTLVQPPRSMQATLDTLRDMLAEDVIEAGGGGGGGMEGGRYVDDFEPVGGLDRGKGLRACERAFIRAEASFRLRMIVPFH